MSIEIEEGRWIVLTNWNDSEIQWGKMKSSKQEREGCEERA